MNATMTAVTDAETWQSLVPEGPLPLQQSWAYGAATALLGARVDRYRLDGAGAPGALAQISGRRQWGLVRLNTVMRGPLWLTDDRDARIAALTRLRQGHAKWLWRPLFILPEDSESEPGPGFYRAAGLRRVMTGFSTAWLDLSADEDSLRAGLKGKWRNALKAAEGSPLTVSIGGRKPAQYQWLLDKEEVQRGIAGYLAPPVGLVDLYALNSPDPQAVLSLTALVKNQKWAGQLFLIHGSSATYHMGWSGDDGRRAGAHTLLLWRAMLELKRLGVRWLDLGGMDTAARAGIARFKLGTGADPVTFSGAWV